MMIKKIVPLLLAVAFTSSVFAQIKISVKESVATIGGGSYPVLIVNVFKAEDKKIDQEWKSKMKSFDAKVSSSKDELFADDANITSISDNTVDVYSKVRKLKDDMHELVVAFNLGGEYLSSQSSNLSYEAAKELLREFGLEVSKEASEDFVKQQEKQLATLETDLRDLTRNKDRYEKNIEKAKKSIEKDEAEIDENEKEQLNKEKAITTQEGTVREAKSGSDSDYSKEQEKILSKLKTDLRDLKRRKEKLEKNIRKDKDDISNWEYDIDKNIKDQGNKEKAIEQQKGAVKDAEKQLKAIE